ncbi:hypothetical protein [Helicobacter magdeburgensis]|nr:hypothetical protein [Helicobacter magdeburgensis]
MAKSYKNTTAEVSCDDFVGCQSGGEGSLLNANDRANTADSRKSTQETTQQQRRENEKTNSSNTGRWYRQRSHHTSPKGVRFYKKSI